MRDKATKPAVIRMADGTKIPLPAGAMHIRRQGGERRLVVDGTDVGVMSNMHIWRLRGLARKHRHMP